MEEEFTISTSWSSRVIVEESGRLTSLDWTCARSEAFGGYNPKFNKIRTPTDRAQLLNRKNATDPAQEIYKNKVIRTGNWSSDRKAGKELWMACKSSTLCAGEGGEGPKSADSIMWRFCLEDIMWDETVSIPQKLPQKEMGRRRRRGLEAGERENEGDWEAKQFDKPFQGPKNGSKLNKVSEWGKEKSSRVLGFFFFFIFSFFSYLKQNLIVVFEIV